MRKALNKVSLQGRVYDHNLQLKTVSDQSKASFGTEFINGTLDIATDDAGLNIVQVHFTYVTAVNKKGGKNSTFTVLKNIIDNPKTIIANGKDEALCVKVDTAVGLNDFYSNRTGEDVLVSAKRCEGGFVSVVKVLPEEKDRNRFECDMLINGTRVVEANEEKNIPEDYLIVKGAVFDFKNSLLPVEFVVKSKGGINYFESLDASPKKMTFTKVWGTINCTTVVTKKEEESAFGEPVVKEYTNTRREWIVTGTSKPDAVYEIGDEKNGITDEEIKKAVADREIYLADVKKRQDEYQASKNNSVASEVPFGTGTASAPAAEGGFNF